MTANKIVENEGIVAQITALPPLSQLEPMWHALEVRAKPSFFLSWHWIGSWLSESGAKPALFVARRNQIIVGLAVIGMDCPRLGPLRVPRIHLNQAGVSDLDCVYIEYNDLLVDPTNENATRAAYLGALSKWRAGDAGWVHWQEMRWVASPIAAEHMPVNPKLLMEKTKTSISPYVDLDAARKNGNDLCALLSSNTRSQIRRAIRLYQAMGELRIDRASTRREALAWLERLRCLHQARWSSRGDAGAFARPFLERFLRRIVEQGFDNGVVDILRVSAGRYDLGYLYNFVYRNRVSNYQSGFRFGPDGRHKPGLVAHTLAVQHYSSGESRLRLYSFLAGSSQYKRSLSTGSEELNWYVYRPKSRLIVLKKAVALLAV
jgi:CelD/BcsL family acetyltransferase involved in cellulose biosynthesis